MRKRVHSVTLLVNASEVYSQAGTDPLMLDRSSLLYVTANEKELLVSRINQTLITATVTKGNVNVLLS